MDEEEIIEEEEEEPIDFEKAEKENKSLKNF